MKVIHLVALMISVFALKAQSVVISETESTPDASAILDVQSSSKGLLIPRMTLSERIDIANPAVGLFVYQTDDVVGFYSYDGTSWSYLVNSSQITDFGSGSIITAEERALVGSALQEEEDPIFSSSAANSITDAGSGNVITDNERNSLGALNPTGTVLAFAGEDLPEGYLWCDGSFQSRETYPDLFATIGTSWGAGDGTTTFNVPDLRGYFLRGRDRDNGLGLAGRDPDINNRTDLDGNTITDGNVVGSYQEDAFQDHQHYAYVYANSGSGETANVAAYNGTGGTGAGGNLTDWRGVSASVRFSDETRPKNAYVNYIIKY